MKTEIAKLVFGFSSCWLLSLHVVSTIRMLRAQFSRTSDSMLHCNSAAHKHNVFPMHFFKK